MSVARTVTGPAASTSRRYAGSWRRWPMLLLPLAGVAAWQAVIWVANPRPWLLPSPGAVARAMWVNRERLWFHAQATILESLVGLGLALAAGLLLAAGIAASRALDRAVYPWLVASQAVPILALTPVMAVWLGYTTTQITVAALVCVFPIIVTGVDGLRSTDPVLARTMRSLGAGRGWVWRHVTLPGALPGLFLGLRMAAVFAVTGAVVAEYVGADRGLGYLTQIATGQFETQVAMAAIVLLAVLGIALFLLVGFLERLALPHKHHATHPTRSHPE